MLSIGCCNCCNVAIGLGVGTRGSYNCIALDSETQGDASGESAVSNSECFGKRCIDCVDAACEIFCSGGAFPNMNPGRPICNLLVKVETSVVEEFEELNLTGDASVEGEEMKGPVFVKQEE